MVPQSTEGDLCSHFEVAVVEECVGQVALLFIGSMPLRKYVVSTQVLITSFIYGKSINHTPYQAKTWGNMSWSSSRRVNGLALNDQIS